MDASARNVINLVVSASYRRRNVGDVRKLILQALLLPVPDGGRSPNIRFANSEEANKLLKPYTGKGWELKI
jgi:hypothetical protein